MKIIEKIINNKNACWNYSATAFFMLTNLLLMFLINNFASLEIFGLVTLLYATSGMLLNIISFRSGESLTKFLIKYDGNDSSIVMISFITDFVSVFLILCLVYFLLDDINDAFFQNQNVRDLIIIVVLSVCFKLSSGSVIGRYTSINDFVTISKLKLVEPIMKISTILFIIMFYKLSLKNIIYTYFISSMISFFIHWVCYFIHGFRLSFNGVTSSLLKNYLTFNFKTFISISVKSFTENADVIIMGIFLDKWIIGSYQSLKLITQPIKFIINPFSAMRYPLYIKKILEGNVKSVSQDVITCSSVFFIITILYSIPLLTLKDIILTWLGIPVKHEVIVLLFYLIALTVGFCAFDWWFRSVSLATNPMFSIYSNLIGLILIWCGGYLSLKYYDISMFCFVLGLVPFVKGLYHIYVVRYLIKK